MGTKGRRGKGEGSCNGSTRLVGRLWDEIEGGEGLKDRIDGGV